MKKTFTILVSLFLTIIAFAGPQPARLSISGTGVTDIRVVIDGNKYRSNNGVVMISRINSGSHFIKVYQVRSDVLGGQRYGRNNYQLVYSGNVNVKPMVHVDIVINRFGRAFFDEQPVAQGNYYDEDDDWGNDNNNGQNNGNYGNRPMDNGTFELLKQAIQKESFADSKMRVAKQAISSNYVSTSQVRELANLFNFDDSKLELAKYAYDFTTDKNNYFLINDVFSFGTSKDELMKYVESRK